MTRYAVGIDLGGTKVEACLVDETRKVLDRRRIPSEPHFGKDRVVTNILKMVDAVAEGKAYEAVGIGTPGTYHPGDDIMYGAPHTPLYENPGLISLLKSRMGVPLVVENDANCLALAEYYAQCRDRYRSIMAVILGTGMGSGLILDGRLYRGPCGNAGEIGHMSVDYRGRACGCGRIGCAEAYLSGPSHSRRYREISGNTLDPRGIVRRWEEGDEKVEALFEESCRIMAEVFADCVNVLDLEAIVLGGGVSNISLWYDRVPELMEARIFGIPGRRPPLLKAVLGDSAGVIGAAYLALREMSLLDF
jgi:fructokinase